MSRRSFKDNFLNRFFDLAGDCDVKVRVKWCKIALKIKFYIDRDDLENNRTFAALIDNLMDDLEPIVQENAFDVQ